MSNDISWLEFGFKFEVPGPWIHDPDFGWLEFSYMPHFEWSEVEAFLRQYVAGYGLYDHKQFQLNEFASSGLRLF